VGVQANERTGISPYQFNGCVLRRVIDNDDFIPGIVKRKNGSKALVDRGLCVPDRDDERYDCFHGPL
jgi:hypothetical protein